MVEHRMLAETTVTESELERNGQRPELTADGRLRPGKFEPARKKSKWRWQELQQKV